MSYTIKFDGLDHQSLLMSTLQAWAGEISLFSPLSFSPLHFPGEDQDIYLVSEEGHRIYTSQRLLAPSSPSLSSLLPPSSSLPGLSLSCSSSSLSSLLSLLTTGEAMCRSREEVEEVWEAARCLGVNINLSQLAQKSTRPPQKEHTQHQKQVNKGPAMENKSVLSKINKNDRENITWENGIKAVQVKKESEIKNKELEGNKHVENISFICEVCKQKLESKKILRRHILRKHKDLVPNMDELFCKVLCKYCPKKFRTKRARYYHKTKMHPGMKKEKLAGPPKWPFCKKLFKTKRTLNIHKHKMHTGMVDQGTLYRQKFKY